MGNILRVLGRDILRLLKAPAAMIVVVALIVLPSIYTWYNVIAFWNPYDDTGNLRVCVVNQDAGADSELTGQLNVGDKIVDALSSNDALDWVIEDYDTAMGELKAGTLYAIYVIPEDFTQCLMSPTTGQVKHPQLQYYVNEKLGPVSPKVTDVGADTLEQTINSMFVATVSEVAVEAIDSAVKDAEADVADTESVATTRMNEAIASIGQVRDSLAQINQATEDARVKSAFASDSMNNAAVTVNDASIVIQDIADETSAIQITLSSVSSETVPALTNLLTEVSQVTSDASTAANGFASSVGAAQADVDIAVGKAETVVGTMWSLSQDLQALADVLPDDDPAKARLEQSAQDLADRANQLQTCVDEVITVSTEVSDTSQAVADAAHALNETAQETSSSIQAYSDTLFNSTAPAVNASLGQISMACANLSTAVSSQVLIIDQVQMTLGQLDGVLADCEAAVTQTDDLMLGLQEDLEMVSADVLTLSQSGLIADLVQGGTLDPQNIADFMGSPTKLKTVELYHPNAYGSSMAPLFMNLTFWIGAFMLVIILRQEVDSEGIRNLTLVQRYIGRFSLLAIFAVLQALVCCAGVLHIGVEAVNLPALFVGAAVSSLAFLSVIYALAVTLRHIGKGLCIVLVFAQIPGASGLYPVELTSRFFQKVYPFFPFSYGIDAMREAIGGFYGNHFAHDMFMLGVFFFGFMALGLLVSPLMSNVNRMVAGQIRESDLFNGEDVITPTRPYRFSQVVRALSDREDFRQDLERRYQKFTRRYPIFIRASIVLGLGMPLVLILVFALTVTEKVTLLTICLLWLVGLFVFLVVVESLRYSFERQLRMGQMTDEHLLGFYSDRERMVPASVHVTSDEALLSDEGVDEEPHEAGSEEEEVPSGGEDGDRAGEEAGDA